MITDGPDEQRRDRSALERLVAADAASRPPDPERLTESIVRRLVALGLVDEVHKGRTS